jgi:hypothetical protein
MMIRQRKQTQALMWFEIGIYITGAGLGILETVKTYPWKPVGYKMVFSLSLTVISMGSSLVGGVFGTFKLWHEAGAGGMWVAVVVCVVLLSINLGILNYKRRMYYHHKNFRKMLSLKSANDYEECLKYGNTSGLQQVQIIQRLICSYWSGTILASQLRRAY